MDKRARQGVITGFILENRDSLYRLAYSYVRDREDALDIVEDSICKALSAAKSLEGPREVKAWFYRIAVNSALDFLRKRKRELYLEADRLESTSDAYRDLDLQSAVMNLSTRNRTIIILRFYEDMKLEEIAEVMGENLNTVKTALYSSLKKLRMLLDDPDELACRREVVPSE